MTKDELFETALILLAKTKYLLEDPEMQAYCEANDDSLPSDIEQFLEDVTIFDEQEYEHRKFEMYPS